MTESLPGSHLSPKLRSGKPSQADTYVLLLHTITLSSKSHNAGLVPPTKVYVSESTIPKAGRGVFARERIRKDEVIEVCPVLVLPQKDYPLAKKTILRNYHFTWGKTTSAICFGYGSFYNHSYTPNATYKKNIKHRTIQFVAIKNIEKGEEITVNYNYGTPDDKKKLWIEEIKPAEQ